MKTKLTIAVSFLLLSLVFFLGCSKKEAVDTPEEPVEEEEVVVEEEPKFFYPLTGMETDEEPKHRAVAVTINNHPQARPQSGLNKADIVYEVLAEGGVTRLLAIYQSEMPETFGPVRSARDYYVHLAAGLDAIYIHHGWSPGAQELILKQGIVDSLNGLYYDGTLFNRASFRKAPHNSYITYENVVKGANDNNFSLEGAPASFRFLTEDEEVTGTDVTGISIDYSTNSFLVRYEYDASLGRYYRYSGGEKMTDYESQEAILIDNILVVETNHRTIDDAGRLEVDITSGGKAYLLQNGKLQEVEWKNIDGRIAPYANGSELPLVPGKTWINFVPSLTQVSQDI
mgnify:CR=1 FL=1